MASLTEVDAARRAARVVDLADLLDRQIALLEVAQTALRKEIMGGLTNKDGSPRSLTAKDAKTLNELSRTLTACIDTKIKWDAAAKKNGEAMTPDELDIAAVNRVKSMIVPKRARALRDIADAHGIDRGANGVKVSKTAAAVLSEISDPDYE
jgi:hypothetical protein